MSSAGAPPPRPVRGLGPVIVVLLIFIAAALGYYQIIYYPPNHTSTTAVFVPPDPHNVTVTIVQGASSDCSPNCTNKTYSPDTITVVIGYNATVVWHNDDGTVHTVTAELNDSSLDPRFTSFGPTSPPTAWDNIASGKSVNFTFTKPGTYVYFCSYHAWMVGSVIVEAGSNSSSSSSSSTVAAIGSTVIGPFHTSSLLTLSEERGVVSKSLMTLSMLPISRGGSDLPFEKFSIGVPMNLALTAKTS